MKLNEAGRRFVTDRVLPAEVVRGCLATPARDWIERNE